MAVAAVARAARARSGRSVWKAPLCRSAPTRCLSLGLGGTRARLGGGRVYPHRVERASVGGLGRPGLPVVDRSGSEASGPDSADSHPDHVARDHYVDSVRPEFSCAQTSRTPGLTVAWAASTLASLDSSGDHVSEDAPSLIGEIAVGSPLTAEPVLLDSDATLNWLILDGRSQPTAQLPGPGGGKASTRTETWQLTIERQRFSWRLLATVQSTNRMVAAASPALGPNSFKLCFYTRSRGESLTLRLSRGFLSGTWTLRQRRTQLATISPRPASNYEIHVKQVPAGLCESVPLVTLLALHTVLIDSSLPRVMGGG